MITPVLLSSLAPSTLSTPSFLATFSALSFCPFHILLPRVVRHLFLLPPLRRFAGRTGDEDCLRWRVHCGSRRRGGGVHLGLLRLGRVRSLGPHGAARAEASRGAEGRRYRGGRLCGGPHGVPRFPLPLFRSYAFGRPYTASTILLLPCPPYTSSLSPSPSSPPFLSPPPRTLFTCTAASPSLNHMAIFAISYIPRSCLPPYVWRSSP